MQSGDLGAVETSREVRHAHIFTCSSESNARSSHVEGSRVGKSCLSNEVEEKVALQERTTPLKVTWHGVLRYDEHEVAWHHEHNILCCGLLELA